MFPQNYCTKLKPKHSCFCHTPLNETIICQYMFKINPHQSSSGSRPRLWGGRSWVWESRGLGAEPPTGSGAEPQQGARGTGSLVGGSGGRSPPEVESFFFYVKR